MLLFRNGKSKGIAYVEFEDEKSAKTAVMKMDGLEFMNKTLSVAISAPPTAADKPRAPGRSNAGLGFSSARKPFAAKTEQKSRISFVPASVQKAANKDANVPSPTQPAMSNEDFRKMLLK